jgi:hypothetical protein
VLARSAAFVGALVLLIAASSPRPTVEFVDITAQAGLRWGITAMTDGADHFIETMGGGGGFVDVDGDGWLDIYFVAYSAEDVPGSRTTRDALYRNNRDGTFTDVSARAGIGGQPYGMGLAAGDYDNDGRPDLYVTGYGHSRLLRNRGDLTFEDVTSRAGVESPLWATGAAFFDADGDGRLDLWVANYVAYKVESSAKCLPVGKRLFCRPASLDSLPAQLFHNEGDERFANVSERAGLLAHLGKGLGVVAFDYDGDGRSDVFQANDGTPNFLFRNQGGLRFEEVALQAGVAYGPEGTPRGGMGTDAFDVRRNGRLDLFVANFTHETNGYFRNEGDGSFSEATADLGLAPSRLLSGFGAKFLDYDGDGLVDLFVVNGHPLDTIKELYPNVDYPSRHTCSRTPAAASARWPPSAASRCGAAMRGAASPSATTDNDGDPDLLLMSVGEKPVLLRNDGGNRRHWLGIALEGRARSRDAVGARVTVTAGALRQSRSVLGGTSYCSVSDRRLLFGLGDARRVDRVEVEWPGGGRTQLEGLKADRYLTVRE